MGLKPLQLHSNSFPPKGKSGVSDYQLGKCLQAPVLVIAGIFLYLHLYVRVVWAKRYMVCQEELGRWEISSSEGQGSYSGNSIPILEKSIWPPDSNPRLVGTLYELALQTLQTWHMTLSAHWRGVQWPRHWWCGISNEHALEPPGRLVQTRLLVPFPEFLNL